MMVYYVVVFFTLLLNNITICNKMDTHTLFRGNINKIKTKSVRIRNKTLNCEKILKHYQ